MKKISTWVLAITFIVFFIDWAVMGLKLLDGNYNTAAEAYTALLCVAIILICIIIRMFSDKCPHCGKLRVSSGKFCPYCGKEL